MNMGWVYSLNHLISPITYQLRLAQICSKIPQAWSA